MSPLLGAASALSEAEGRGHMSPLLGVASERLSEAVRQNQYPVAGLSAIGKRGHAEIFSGLPGRVATVRLRAPLAMENPLARRLTQWELCGVSPWVLRTIAKGYRLQFAMRPPAFGEVLFSDAQGQTGDVLHSEILSLLNKKAIREVPLSQSRSGFYSRYFLVKKKGGGSVRFWTSEHSTDTSRPSTSRC